MKLSVEDALATGFESVRQRNGLLLFGIVYALTVVESVFGTASSFTFTLPGGEELTVDSTAIVEVSPLADSLIALLVGVAGLLTTIAALRVFASDETEPLPLAAFTRRGVRTFANAFVGAIVFAVVVALGFAALVLPGLYLLSALFLWAVFVAVEDENFLDALRSSWRLTSGHRLQTFLLGVAFLLVAFLVNIATAIPITVFGAFELDFLITNLGSAFVTVFGNGVLVAAYQQLSTDEAKPTPDV
ncbi:hypothetical protein U3A55_10090 [Salarchaeum sp. III]|uniref:hypothetical protein n=1 Tax=Salarchaeum sp. III TaxID=3107927 RepID=UPI002ED9E0D7